MAKYVESLSERDNRLEREQKRARERNAKKRETRREVGNIRKQERQALNDATSTEQRKEIKRAAEEATFKFEGFSSAGGDQKGGVYDLSTDTYNQPKRNQVNQDVSIEEAGIDTIDGNSAGDTTTNDSGLPDGYSEISVTICIDGTPTTGTILFKS